jgi:hypothetical protein
MSLELEFLQEYRAVIIVEDDIEQYFTNPVIPFIINEKQNQTE